MAARHVSKGIFPHTQQAAKLLADCRKVHPKEPLAKIPNPFNPTTTEAGYEIAAATTKLLKLPVGGYKCAATNDTAMVCVLFVSFYFALNSTCYTYECFVLYFIIISIPYPCNLLTLLLCLYNTEKS